jgi:hypothetical protein
MLKDQAGDLAVNCQVGPNPVNNLTGLIVPPALVRPSRWDDRNNFAVMHKTVFSSVVLGVREGP